MTMNAVVLMDITTHTAVPVLNNNFTIGAGTAPYDAPGGGAPDWNFYVQPGNDFAQYLGYEANGGFYDGSTQAYDGIYQDFVGLSTTDQYQVSFHLSPGGFSSPDTYLDQSENGDTTDTGGNGIDLVVYAGATTPTNAMPDGASTLLMLLASGVGLLGFRKAVKPRQSLATW